MHRCEDCAARINKCAKRSPFLLLDWI